jgi:c-di-GMP-binding flagellar brake protein YcgR
MPKLTKRGRKKNPSSAEPERLKSPEDDVRSKSEPTEPARERRKDSRLAEENKVVIELLTDGRTMAEKTIINALTRDISPGGVRVMTNVFLPVDTLLKIEIVLSRRRRLVNAVGMVRWTRSVYGEEMFEIGIEFTQISPDDKMLLLEHTYRKRG